MTRRGAPAAEASALDTERLFRPLAGAQGVVLAVSGGPDSTALMLLFARWRERPPALVVTVDHGLRAEAAAEARQVAANATSLGLPHRTMQAPERAGAGNLQDWARRARYAALAAAARDAGFDAIVTGHHREDQAETFLLRLARGSGVYGLAAMEAEGAAEGVRLLRPLLALPRAVLAEIAASSGLAIADDASNRDPRFDRVRIREIMPALAERGLTAARIAETTGRLARAAAALDHYAAELLADFHVTVAGVVGGSIAGLVAAPEDVSLRALAVLLKAVGGAEYTPRLPSVENLRAAILTAGPEGRLKRTLHGAVLTLAEGRLTARREWGRKGPAPMDAAPGATLVWDRRFRVVVPPLPGRLSVGPLGNAPRKLRHISGDSAALRTMPGLHRDGELAAVPDGVAALEEAPALARLDAECLVGERLTPGRHAARSGEQH